jgi:hypothetical protein
MQRRKTFLGTIRKSLEVVEKSHPLTEEDRDASLDTAHLPVESMDC